MSRRDMMQRVLLLTSSVPVTAAVLTQLGCGNDDDAGGSANQAAMTAPTQAAQPVPPPTVANPSGVTVHPNDQAISVEQVSFQDPASQLLGYLAKPKTGGSYLGVVVIHENRGLLDHCKDVARRYATEGYGALAVTSLPERPRRE